MADHRPFSCATPKPQKVGVICTRGGGGVGSLKTGKNNPCLRRELHETSENSFPILIDPRRLVYNI